MVSGSCCARRTRRVFRPNDSDRTVRYATLTSSRWHAFPLRSQAPDRKLPWRTACGVPRRGPRRAFDIREPVLDQWRASACLRQNPSSRSRPSTSSMPDGLGRYTTTGSHHGNARNGTRAGRRFEKSERAEHPSAAGARDRRVAVRTAVHDLGRAVALPAPRHRPRRRRHGAVPRRDVFLAASVALLLPPAASRRRGQARSTSSHGGVRAFPSILVGWFLDAAILACASAGRHRGGRAATGPAIVADAPVPPGPAAEA